MKHHLLAVALGISSAAADVPLPADTPARVVVSGRTSTLQEVKVVRVGDQIPRTFSGERVKNTEGFAWWVSQHYALKTDWSEERARFFLGLLELAYPHYVELFGKEPARISEKRMAVCYASSKEQLGKALASDGIKWDFNGGGITYEGFNCSYIYPSGSLQYHLRYILLHECTHLFQQSLNGNVYTTPSWYYEGVADTLGSHVYDLKKRQLTVNVLDKATTTNYLDEGWRALRAKPSTVEEIHRAGGAERGVSFLLIHFLSDDFERARKFRQWRDELFKAKLYNQHQELSAKLLQELYGPWDKINADFQAWLAARHNTFHYVEWGWEQDGNTLWSYGFAEGSKLSRTDVNLIPNERPRYDPLRMDYPAEPISSLVGPIARGVREPSVGAVIDFSRNPNQGVAGIGLGVGEGERAGYVRLLIARSRELAMDGSDLGLGKKTIPLSDDVRAAMAASDHRIGLTAKIAAKSLDVTLRAKDPSSRASAECKASLPLTNATRARLLSSPLTILARDGYHGVTPFFDDARRLEPSLLVPAPPNRWRKVW